MNQRKENNKIQVNAASSEQLHPNHQGQHQQQQQYQFAQQQKRNSASSFNMMNSRGYSQQAPAALNGKDLIIRMLAEVFQVNQLEDGQVKWQQVSSSLVPISLYSRTTSRWLNFLLAASGSNSMAAAAAGTTASAAMSPDSRDFLILLQQFHQQQQMDELVNSSAGPFAATLDAGPGNNKNLVVFQVVAHDYCDGLCKKILNVKIAQPGSRLGQASDFFVYWKEQRHLHHHHHHHQQQQQYNQVPFPQSTFASNNSTQNFPSSSYKPMCCQQDLQQQQQTWGLNFASVNDAKLFYDICSLNLVDLNFNSEYLKQLASNDMMRRELAAANVITTSMTTGKNNNNNKANNLFATMQQEQQQQLANNNPETGLEYENKKLIRDFLNYKQRRNTNLTTSDAMRQNRISDNSTIKRQLSNSSSKCQSCKRMIQQQQQQLTTRQQQSSRQLSGSRNYLPAMDESDTCCPMHSHTHSDALDNNRQQGHQLARQGSSGGTSTRPFRSRSSTRHQELAAPCHDGPDVAAGGDLKGVKRARSFSTPASPEKEASSLQAADCPVHKTTTRTRHQSYNQQQQQESSTDCERQETHHHPRCLNFMRQQQEQLQAAEGSRKQLLKKQQLMMHRQPSSQEAACTADNRPKKPVRGVLRDSVGQSRDLPPIVPVRQSSIGGGSNKTTPRQPGTTPKSAVAQQSISGLEYCKDINSVNENFYFNKNDPDVYKQAEADQQAAARFVSSRASQRRSTTAGGHGLHTANSDGNHTQHFDSNSAHSRSARLARAQYANSKNMKEFLSLDAGGCQQQQQQQQQQSSTPVQLVSRFQQEHLNANNNKQSDLQNQQQSSAELQSSIEKTTQSHESMDGAAIPARNAIPHTDDDGIMFLHNVATTTDDLPLDPNTRRRMFKLTSEEVISERTEPRSLSTPSIAMDTQQQQQQKQVKGPSQNELDEHDRRELRAVSLGPEVAESRRELGGQRHSRSSTASSRRRSLERASCVDLMDNTAPAASNGANAGHTGGATHFKKTSYRLSPLESRCNGAGGSQPQSAIKAASHATTLPKRQRTRSSGAADRRLLVHEDCCLAANAGALPFWQGGFEPQAAAEALRQSNFIDPIMMSNTTATRYNQQQQQQCSSMATERSRLLGFKSVPDFSQLRHQQCNMADQLLQQQQPLPLHQPLAHYGGDWGAQGCINVPQAKQYRKNMSPYEVPICFGPADEEQHLNLTPSYGRQSRSCPNSLRRKRKVDIHHHNHHQLHLQQQQQQLRGLPPSGYPDEPLDGYISSQWAMQTGGCRCSACGLSCELEAAAADGVVASAAATRTPHGARSVGAPFHACSLCMMAAAPQGNANYLAGFSSAAQQGYHNCTNAKLTSGCCPVASLERHAAAASNNRASVLQHWRPCSSQSSKSPLHYGLYESDCEDHNNNEHLIELSNQNSTCPQVRAAAAACCRNDGAHGVEASSGGLDRSVSAYFSGANSGSRAPIHGYDQTMARTALKSRQRARSQPPDSETDDAAIRLNKSMENVQKLITEVQNELSLMTKTSAGANVDVSSSAPAASQQPDSGGRCLAVAGTANSKRADPPRAGIKMSNEEQSARQQQQQQQQASMGAPSTSATRRAGQFKCVGAIRKAGFLSVKKWILKRRQSIELARKQGWKRYWVCLRGTALLFHSVIDKQRAAGEWARGDIDAPGLDSNDNCTDLLAWIRANCCAAGQDQLVASLMQQSTNSAEQAALAGGQNREAFLRSMAACYIEREPRHLIVIEGAIVQPIPEHPKRDHVFCLSTTFGDAYLFQASCQLESDNWISAMHNACAASLARDLTRDEAMKLFEAKVRHLELEAEKKLFLRQRLESRLTTMSSIGASIMLESSAAAAAATDEQHSNGRRNANLASSQTAHDHDAGSDNQKVTFRSLLYRLNQQLIALDTYLEQVHCEIYQLRCYLSSCGAQQMFYQNLRAQGTSGSPAFASIELPHPRNLLMHVSKPTKVMLIKLGVFTVSSFHAYIHARQGSADGILQRIHQQQLQQQNKPLELRLRAQSISERLLTTTSASNRQNQELETDTEQLIHLSNLRAVSVRMDKRLYESIRLAADQAGGQQMPNSDADSEDRQSVRHSGDYVIINLKLHSSSSSATIIKRVLKILQASGSSATINGELAFLNYYLRLETTTSTTNIDNNNKQFIVAKRRETLNDWLEFEYLELLEKSIFRVQLIRRRLDEEACPFGIAVGAQLFVGKFESQLNVYCSYIEWGSVADKVGLRDDDELLVINGIPVMDLDMMFVECILQDEQSLKLVVRSCRAEPPPAAEPLDSTSWQRRPPTAGGGGSDNTAGKGAGDPTTGGGGSALTNQGGASQIISDEYISSLVCPPPPAKSDAFLRSPESGTLLRQKSDMGIRGVVGADSKLASSNGQRLVSSKTSLGLAKQTLYGQTKSHHDLSLESLGPLDAAADNRREVASSIVINADQLAGQLLRKTDQLNRLLLDSSSNDEFTVDNNKQNKSDIDINLNSANGSNPETTVLDPNCVERLRKSILELLETEYAYIKHLETISDHYMAPMGETSYLNIAELRLLNQSIVDLIAFQRDFFNKLTGSIWAKYEMSNGEQQSQQHVSPNAIAATDESEELNKIVQQLEMFKTIDHFKPLILSLAKPFISESDRFKIYAAYCVAYSKLQKFLHPKRAGQSSFATTSMSCPMITSAPIALDTFLTSSGSGISASNLTGGQQPREFFKPLGSFMANNSSINLMQNNCNTNEFVAKLRQLSEFLGNLDSSSSSASLSLPKTTNSDLSPGKSEGNTITNNNSNNKRSPKNSSTTMPFQRSVHQQNFESYLIKPIQRIVKYPMLLNSIAVSAQIYKDEELDFELQVAVKQMGSTTSYVNDAQRIHDEYGPVFEHIERQFTSQHQPVDQPMSRSSNTSASAVMIGAHQPPISLAIEQLLYFGPVAWLNISEITQNSKQLKNTSNLNQMLFVFESCVVFICKEQLNRSNNKKRFSSTSANQTQSNVTNNAGCNSTNSFDHSGGLTQPSATSSLTTSTFKASLSQKSTIISSEQTSSIIRYQSLIPVSEVQVRSVPTASNANQQQQHQFQWELFRCSSVNSNSSLLTKSNKRQTSGKVYLLSSATNESRNAFLRKIRFIIRESVRNMSLPSARSPSSKSITPKKMSSPSLATNTNSSCSTSLSPVCHSGGKHQDEKGCKFGGSKQVCDNSSYKTSIEVNN